jgi:Zn ribbon nucleic-acid-binding protein
MTCPRCNTYMSDKAEYCVKCGYKKGETMTVRDVKDFFNGFEKIKKVKS